MPVKMTTQQRSKGFFLVEVLVAMVILGAGLLGTAMILIKNTKNVHKSLIRGQSSALAVEIVEHMRINFNESVGGNYNIAIGAAIPPVVEDCGPDGDGLSIAVCSSAELAAYDLNQWLTRVAAILPGGTASILTDVSKTPAEVTVTIQYTYETSTETQSYLLSIQ